MNTSTTKKLAFRFTLAGLMALAAGSASWHASPLALAAQPAAQAQAQSSQTAPTQYAPMPEAVSSFGAAVSDGWLYIYGGHLDKTHTYTTTSVSGQFHRLSLADGKTWEKLPEGPNLQGMNLVSYDGKIYRVGGMQPRAKQTEKSDNHSVDLVSVYEPKSGTTTALPSLPEPRSSHDAVVVGSKLYVIGGWRQLGSDRNPTWPMTIPVIDLADPAPTWSTIPQPFERRALIATEFKGRIFVMGGLDTKAARLQDVEIFNPQTGAWTKGPGFPGGDRNGFAPAACVLNNRLYLNIADGSVLRLSEDEKSWELVGKSNPMIVGRMVPNQDQLLVLGGASKIGEGKNLDEIQVVVPK